MDQWARRDHSRVGLLHAADDIDEVVSRGTAAGDQHVEDSRWRIPGRDDVYTPSCWLGELGPVPWVAHADIGEIKPAPRSKRIIPQQW